MQMAALPANVREALEREVASLDARRWNREGLELVQEADLLDQIQGAMDRALAAGQFSRLTKQQRELRAALQRVEDGSYGECEQCGDAIPEKRLQALPWARHCVRCQERLDARGAHAEEDWELMAA